MVMHSNHPATPPNNSSRPGKQPRERAAPEQGVGRQVVRAVAEQATQQVSGAAKALKGQGGEFLAQQKRRAAAELTGVAGSIRETAGQLEQGPLGGTGVTAYVEAAADGAETVARYLDERDLGDLVDDAADVVRRQPRWFVGGLFVAGLAMARFVKASQTRAAASSGGEQPDGNAGRADDADSAPAPTRKRRDTPRPATPPATP